jgi:monolysocardiolipin acyltransferase
LIILLIDHAAAARTEETTAPLSLRSLLLSSFSPSRATLNQQSNQTNINKMDALAADTDPKIQPPPACWSQLASPPWGAWGRDATLGLVAALGKLLLLGLNTTTVTSPGGAERLKELVVERRLSGARPSAVVGAETGLAPSAAAASASAAGAEGLRPQGLLTYSNHTSTFDDPGILVALLPLSFFWTEHRHERVRWTLCAREICFRNPALAAFFRSGKAFPVQRANGGIGNGGGSARRRGQDEKEEASGNGGSDGNTKAGGLDQPAMVAAAHALGGRGDWVHLFPEGKVYDFRKERDRQAAVAAEEAQEAWRRGRGDDKGGPKTPSSPPLLGPFRQGVGKLVCDARRVAGGRDPMVVPIAHAGMEQVLPRGGRVPRVGKTVKVAVGEPVDVSGLTCGCDSSDPEERERAWRDIAAALRGALSELQGTID